MLTAHVNHKPAGKDDKFHQSNYFPSQLWFTIYIHIHTVDCVYERDAFVMQMCRIVYNVKGALSAFRWYYVDTSELDDALCTCWSANSDGTAGCYTCYLRLLCANKLRSLHHSQTRRRRRRRRFLRVDLVLTGKYVRSNPIRLIAKAMQQKHCSGSIRPNVIFHVQIYI